MEGTVERIVYSGGDGAFTVARLKVEGGAAWSPSSAAWWACPAGAVLRVAGGSRPRRASASSSASRATPKSRPQTMEGMRRYLGSGLIKGIGPEFASRIVDRFGIETLEILDREPGRIGEVPASARRARAPCAPPGARGARCAR